MKTIPHWLNFNPINFNRIDFPHKNNKRVNLNIENSLEL